MNRARRENFHEATEPGRNSIWLWPISQGRTQADEQGSKALLLIAKHLISMEIPPQKFFANFAGFNGTSSTPIWSGCVKYGVRKVFCAMIDAAAPAKKRGPYKKQAA